MAKKGNKAKKNAAAANSAVLATNRKARHDFKILDTYEAGMVLVGTEIKAMREGKILLVDAFATLDKNEIWLRNLHIPEYSMGHWTNHSPKRTRKLLLHRREIDKLMGQVRDGSRTLIPLKVYLKDGKAKCEIALAEGKLNRDKREDIKRRDINREVSRELGRRVKGINA